MGTESTLNGGSLLISTRGFVVEQGRTLIWVATAGKAVITDKDDATGVAQWECAAGRAGPGGDATEITALMIWDTSASQQTRMTRSCFRGYLDLSANIP